MNRNWKPSKSEILSKHVGTFLEIYGGDFPWGLPPINLHNPLNMCSWEILWPIKNIFAHYHSPCNHKTYQGGHIPQGGSSHPWTPMTLYWSCHVTPRGKLNTSYLQLYKTRGHQTRQDADLQWEVPILIAVWPFDLVTKLSSLDNLKNWYFHYHKTYGQ